MRRALLLLALLIAAVAVGTQQWGWRTVLLPFASFKKPACGHLKISEYILTSSRVLLPAGVFPAASESTLVIRVLVCCAQPTQLITSV